MTVCAEKHLVTCKFLTQRFTVHNHGLFGNVETQLERALERQFKWLTHVWVDADVPRQFTVKFDASSNFYQLSEEMQRAMSLLLINKTLEFISWAPGNTCVEFEDF